MSGTSAGPPVRDAPPAALLVVAFVAMGLYSGGFGVLWEAMADGFGRTFSSIGFVLGAGAVGFLAAALGNRWLHPRLGTARQLALSAAVIGAGLALFAWSPDWNLLLLGSALAGAGAGSLEAALNTDLSVGGQATLLQLVHGGFGVGATLGPLVAGWLIHGGAGWRAGVAALVVVWALVATGVTVTRRRPATVVSRSPSPGPSVDREPHPQDRTDAGGRRPAGPRVAVVVVVALGFTAYTSSEMAVGYLALPLLQERGMAELAASRWIAAYWASLTVGRLVLGTVRRPVPAGRLVSVAIVVAAVGTTLLWLGPHDVAPVGLAVAGAGFAGIFPAMVALIPERVGRHAAAGVVGVAMAAASAGMTLGPAVVAQVADAWGVDAIGPALVAVVATLAAVHTIGLLVCRGSSGGGRVSAPVDWPQVVADEP